MASNMSYEIMKYLKIKFILFQLINVIILQNKINKIQSFLTLKNLTKVIIIII